MNWTIEIDEKAKDELLKLDREARKRIIKFIDERLLKLDDPRKLGESLKGNLSGFWRYRVGDYRLICDIEDSKVNILVIGIGHRRNIYKLKF